MFRLSLTIMIVSLLMAGLPSTGEAGADEGWMPAPSTAELVALENLRLLDQRVRLKSHAYNSAIWNIGTYEGMRDGEIQLRTDSGTTMSVAQKDLKDFQVSTGTKSNATTGMMIGGALGFFVGYSQGSSEKYRSNGNLLSDKFASAGVGAMTGILIGALLGSQTKVEQFSDLNDYLNPELKVRATDEWQLSLSFAF
ncbi:MAG: hypothetical protein QNL91_04870 [Candidatus Krumholzibacteria bacterium]|nr:hypothetical protein [Candidatus Krumholzibacteria bacterium]